MNKLVALSLAIGGVGGIMTWIYTSTPLALSIPISFSDFCICSSIYAIRSRASSASRPYSYCQIL